MYIVKVLMALLFLTMPAKALDFYVGFPPGGGYDLYARFLAKHLDRYLNEPVIIRNQPGASSLALTNWLAQTDEQVIGTINNSMMTNALVKVPNANYDARKLHWLASLNNEIMVCFFRKDANITRLDQGAIIGLTQDSTKYVRMLEDVAGAKFKSVGGYPGGNDVYLAIERNEVQGQCSIPYSSVRNTRPQWLKNNMLNFTVQLSTQKHPELPNVPLLEEFLLDKRDIDIVKFMSLPNIAGRPIVASSASSKEFVNRLRNAIDKTVVDKEFIAEAQKVNLEVNYVSGVEIEKHIDYLHNVNPSVIERVKQYVK